VTVQTYVYAIVARDLHLPPGLTGLGDGELSMAGWHKLAAVTSPLAAGRLRAIPEYVLRHGAVVEGLQQHGPTLPVRFGTVVADADAVVQVLAERHEELAADLARLGDKVEMGLSILWDPPPVDGSHQPGDLSRRVSGSDEELGPGARYLRARLAATRQDAAVREAARAIADEVDAALGSDVLERRCSVVPTARLAVRASFLMSPTRFEACQHAIDGLRRRHPELRYLVSGPWPPYTFVSRDETGERSTLSQSLHELSRWLIPPSMAG